MNFFRRLLGLNMSSGKSMDLPQQAVDTGRSPKLFLPVEPEAERVSHFLLLASSLRIVGGDEKATLLSHMEKREGFSQLKRFSDRTLTIEQAALTMAELEVKKPPSFWLVGQPLEQTTDGTWIRFQRWHLKADWQVGFIRVAENEFVHYQELTWGD